MGRMGMFMGLAAVGAAGEYGIAGYFFYRTVMRGNAKRRRAQKMTGTSWGAYVPEIRASKEWLAGQEKEDVFITSTDGLGLHGTLFPCEGSEWAVVCSHGCTSEELNNFSSIARFYLEKGFNLMVADERAHGKSEGTYAGLGCLDRHDTLGWVRYVVSRPGQDCGLMFRGVSAGGATVLVTTGLTLPPQVRVVVSDCTFTSTWEVFSHVLRPIYHMPAFPMIQIADYMAREEAGYGLDECNARNEMKRAKIPTLFIHGGENTFVPCSMVYDLYNVCRSSKLLLVVSEASHAEAHYKDTESYENAMDQLIRWYLDCRGIREEKT